MGKASDIRNYHDSADEIERLHRHLKERFVDYAAQIQKFIEDLEDEEIEELSEYLRYLMGNHVSENVSISVSMDRVKAAFLLFSKLTDNCCSDTVLSYLESVEFGWHENNEYYLSNSCLRRCLYSPEGHCKMVSKLDSMELVGEYLNKIYEIFFDEEYGSIILFIFSYCLASLFSSVLNQYGIFVPFFLQITCDRNSTLYQLITEIIEICDVNSGLLQNCNKLNRDYRYCGYTSQIYFPTTSTAKDIEELIGNFRDRPVIIAGHENERNYNALLREVANVPIKKRNLALKDRFNLMPVFVSPMIKSSFDNVFDMDLTDVEISEDYLVSVKRNKQVLAAWVLELITGERNVYQPIRRNGQRPPIKKNLLVREIGSYMNSVSQRYPSLLLKNSQNVGFLNFFFKQFLGIFSKFCNISSDEKFECFIQGKENLQQSKEEIVSMLADLSEKRLVELHHRYLPAPTGVGLKDKAAIRLAKQIEKEYRTLGVQIRVTSAEMKEDRYIFTVDTLSRTKDTDVSKNADTIQKRLKKYEYFWPDTRDKTKTKLIVAEKPLKDNSLIGILESKEFADSKMVIPYAIGYDSLGEMCIEDLKEFPHLLLGGATKSGKSVAMISLLTSIAYKHRTGDVNALILDLLEKEESDFNLFDNQPFLASPVITDPIVGAKAILSLYEENKSRAKNKNLPEMPYIVCVIDEFPRLFSDVDDKKYEKRIEAAISDLLSTGRHQKIHLVLAAQNPVKDYMKKANIANITARIALKCAHYQNSNALLSRSGAEKLMGQGQMIFDSMFERDKRLQGSFISEDDAKKLLYEIKKSFVEKNNYHFTFKESDSAPSSEGSNDEILAYSQTAQFCSDDKNELAAIMWSLSQSKIAKSKLLDYLHIGDKKAGKIFEKMENWGLIHRLAGNTGWKVLPKCIEDMPKQALDFLKSGGISEAELKNAFQAR